MWTTHGFPRKEGKNEPLGPRLYQIEGSIILVSNEIPIWAVSYASQ